MKKIYLIKFFKSTWFTIQNHGNVVESLGMAVFYIRARAGIWTFKITEGGSSALAWPFHSLLVNVDSRRDIAGMCSTIESPRQHETMFRKLSQT